MISLGKQCFRFRELLGTLISRELRARYRGSVLGHFWVVLQPLMFLGLFAIVFSQFLEAALPADFLERRPFYFPIAMFCGLVPWISFSEATARGTNSILEHGNLIKKFAFPSELLAVYLVGVSLINTLIGHAILALVVFFCHGEPPHFAWMIPIALLLQGVFSLGFIYVLSSLSVFVRDITHMVPLFLNFWMFMSPIFMFGRFTTEPLHATVMRWNPLTYLLETYRAIYVYHPSDASYFDQFRAAATSDRFALLPGDPTQPPWAYVGIFGAFSVVLLILGYRLFMALKPRFADEV